MSFCAVLSIWNAVEGVCQDPPRLAEYSVPKSCYETTVAKDMARDVVVWGYHCPVEDPELMISDEIFAVFAAQGAARAGGHVSSGGSGASDRKVASGGGGGHTPGHVLDCGDGPDDRVFGPEQFRFPRGCVYGEPDGPVTVAPVPVPATGLLLFSALFGVAAARRVL